MGIKQKWFLQVLNAPGTKWNNTQQKHAAASLDAPAWLRVKPTLSVHQSHGSPWGHQGHGGDDQLQFKLSVTTTAIEICGAIYPFQDEITRFGKSNLAWHSKKSQVGWRRFNHLLAVSWCQRARNRRQEQQLLSLSLQRGRVIEELQPAERRHSGRCHYK